MIHKFLTFFRCILENQKFFLIFWKLSSNDDWLQLSRKEEKFSKTIEPIIENVHFLVWNFLVPCYLVSKNKE